MLFGIWTLVLGATSSFPLRALILIITTMTVTIIMTDVTGSSFYSLYLYCWPQNSLLKEPQSSLLCSQNPIKRQLFFIHTPTTYYASIHLDTIFSSMPSLPSVLFPWGSRAKTLYEFLIYSVHVVRLNQFRLLNFFPLTINKWRG
jgi:hypothetical protein